MSTTIFRLHQLTTFRSYQLLTFAYVNYSLSLMSTTIFILQQLKNLLLTNMFIFHNLFVTYFVYILSTAFPNPFASTFQQPFLPAFSFFCNHVSKQLSNQFHFLLFVFATFRQGWALRSFPFGTLRSFPFLKKNVPFFSRVFGDL